MEKFLQLFTCVCSGSLFSSSATVSSDAKPRLMLSERKVIARFPLALNIEGEKKSII